MAAIAHPGDEEDEWFGAGVGDSVGVAAVDVVGGSDGHLFHPSLSFSIHEDQCALPSQRPHEFASIGPGVEVTAGHVVLTPDRSRLNYCGGVEQPGLAFYFAGAPMGFIDNLIGIVDGVHKDGSELAKSPPRLGRSTSENAGRQIKE